MQNLDCPSSLSQRRLPEADGDICSDDVKHNVMRAAAASRPDELVVAWAFGLPHAGLDDRQCRVRGSRPCLTAKARGLVLTVSSWESSCQRMISAAQTTLLVLHAASIRFRMATHSRRCTSRNSGHQIMSWVVVKPEQPRATCVGVEVVVTSKPISAMT